MKIKVLGLFTVLFLQIPVCAQSFEKIADNTITYLKAGTFGKPSVIKKTNKMALAHVRVHFKFATTQAIETRNNGAKVSVYLDGAMTNADLQNLTDEFYRILQRKLAAVGIESVDWKAIEATEYFANRVAATEEKKRTGADAKNGQAWVSFSAFDGPVFLRVNPASGYPDELLAFGKVKKIAGMAETLGAEIGIFDAVVDFTSINMQTNVGTIYEDGGRYTEYTAGGSIAELMSVPTAYTIFLDQKNGFDQYQSKLPVAVRGGFAKRIYQDDNKAALKTRTFFGDTRFTFTPSVIEVDRDRYLFMARRALEQYADLFVEKMRLLRSGEKPQDSNKQTARVERNPEDKSLEKVKEEARQNNTTSAVTFDENIAAAKQAVAEKKWNLAADYLGAAIKLEPQNFQIYFDRGTIYMNGLQNYKAAIEDFTKALELNPKEIASLYNRGAAYIQLSEFKKAIKDLDAFIAVKSDMPEAYLNRGVALLNTKKTDEAIENFNVGLRLNPRFPNLYRARAIAYKVKGNNAEAQADELRAAQLEGGR